MAEPSAPLEAVTRIDALFDIERSSEPFFAIGTSTMANGLPAGERLAARQALARPLVTGLHDRLASERGRMSRHAPVAKAIDDLLPDDRWAAFTRFLDDGRIRLSNNAAERSLRGVALGRKSWLFAGSERGGDRAAFMDTLIVTAKMNDIDPQAWRADVLARLSDTKLSRVPELLPWNWKSPIAAKNEAA